MTALETLPICLKPGREKSILARHLWIFSGAVQNPDDIHDGSVHPVHSSQGAWLGLAYFNRRCSIIGRMIGFQRREPQALITQYLKRSIALRKSLFAWKPSTMCRLVHAEADLLPGLVIDLYGDVAVLQIATLGMERFKELIVQTLREEISLSWIYERSSSGSRKIEGLGTSIGTLWGIERTEVLAEEEDLLYSIDIKQGQKTGFFLDQREMRGLIKKYATCRRVLNCFSYSGGFSLASLKGNAISCHSVDASQSALSLLEKNLQLNGLQGTNRHTALCEDVFTFLREKDSLPYDLVILDPPAFAKKPGDLSNALKGYREINSQVMKKIPPGGLLLTCSCSHFVSNEHFCRMLKEASLQAGRHVRILTGHHNSSDHPISLTHPENEYLKSYFLSVE